MINISKRITNTDIAVNSILFKLIMYIFIALYKSKILRPNRLLDVIETEDYNFILTPLSGSSTIRSLYDNIKKTKHIDCYKKTYILYRDDASRFQSFYNKKLRNPTNFGKIALLASCYPLSTNSTIDEFLLYLQKKKGNLNKDKHILSNSEILELLRLESATWLSIINDKKMIESLLEIKINKVFKSSKDVSLYKKIKRFSSSEIIKLRKIYESCND